MLKKLHVFWRRFLLLLRVVLAVHLVIVEDGGGIAVEAEVCGGVFEPGDDGDSEDEGVEF